jgi:hypothetical protein
VTPGNGTTLKDDVTITMYHKRLNSKMFSFSFNVGFIKRSRIVLSRRDIDTQHLKDFPLDFKVCSGLTSGCPAPPATRLATARLDNPQRHHEQ